MGLPGHVPDHDPAAELRSAGLVPTARRRVVLTALESRQRPVSAIELHERLRGEGYRIGLTTVYRTLNALTEAGLVHSFHRDGELTYRYCWQNRRHHHLVCEACGLVIERPAGDLAPWLEWLRAETGFVPNPDHTDLVGLCGTCQRDHRCHHLLDREDGR